MQSRGISCFVDLEMKKEAKKKTGGGDRKLVSLEKFDEKFQIDQADLVLLLDQRTKVSNLNLECFLWENDDDSDFEVKNLMLLMMLLLMTMAMMMKHEYFFELEVEEDGMNQKTVNLKLRYSLLLRDLQKNVVADEEKTCSVLSESTKTELVDDEDGELTLR